MPMEGSQPYPIARPERGHAEVDAEDWYSAATTAIQRCIAQLDSPDIAGLAVDGPAHNAALLDDDGAVLAPVLHWSDLRSKPQADRLAQESGSTIERLSLHPSNPSWTLAQLAWIREERPDVFAAASCLQVTKDFVRFRLTGSIATDPYDAVGTQLYDSIHGGWSDELCSLVGLRASDMPPILLPAELAGAIHADASTDTGLKVGTPVFTGTGDTTAEALGVGMNQIGETVVKLATSGVVLTLADRAEPDPTLLTYPYPVEPLWIAMASTNAAASSIGWFKSTFLATEKGFDSIEAIGDLASQSPPGARGVLFHPFLSGERSPYWDADLHAAFTGMSSSTTLSDLARAVMEGVALSLRDGASVLESLGHEMHSIRLLGGGAQSNEWARIVADVFEKPLNRSGISASAYGTAVLAGIGLGWFNWQDLPVPDDPHQRTFEPDPANAGLYRSMFARYREIVPTLSHNHDVA